MKTILHKNLANIIVIVRIAFVFVVIFLFNAGVFLFDLEALGLLTVTALLDWADGYVARRLNISSKIGGLLDTVGDRITENLFFVFFAYKNIVPLYLPLFFITRSFLADFIRTLSFKSGMGTFDMHKSRLGGIFVASQFSRILYLVMKFAIFFMAGFILTLKDSGLFTFLMAPLQNAVLAVSALTAVFCLLRFACLLYDSRSTLRQEFVEGKTDLKKQ